VKLEPEEIEMADWSALPPPEDPPNDPQENVNQILSRMRKDMALLSAGVAVGNGAFEISSAFSFFSFFFS
jgi:hypothetical protein